MKSIKTMLAALILTAAILPFVSCKKGEPAIDSRSVMEKISGKWKLQSSVYDRFYSGVSHSMTYTGTAADYADFRSDGRVYSFIDNSYDTSAYGFISPTKIYIETFTNAFNITLTDVNLKLYQKQFLTGGDYNESTVNLTR